MPSHKLKRNSIDDNPNDYWAYTNCAGCYGNCGVAAHVVEGVCVHLEGSDDTPLGCRGGLCGKGTAQLMSLYDPNRIKYPVKRTNPKKGKNEDPGWVRISWDEALGTIAAQHRKVLEYDPRAVLFGGTPSPGASSTLGVTWPGFFLGLGSMNFAPGGVGLHCGNGAHFGAGLVHCSWSILPDYKYCNLAIQFGSNKGTGSGHGSGPNMGLAADARARGMKNIVFDPLCNFGGGKATEWIPILPGTDLAVILSMCNYIVNEAQNYDEPFLKKYTNGPYLVGPDMLFVRHPDSNEPLLWDEIDKKAKAWNEPTLHQEQVALLGEFEVNGVKCRPAFHLIKEHLKQYNPEWAEKVSTVPAATIRRITSMFLEEARIGSTTIIEGVEVPYRPVSAVMFRGGQGHSNSFHQYLSMCLLNQLVGSVEAVGGTVSWPARSMGYPGTGKPNYKPEPGEDGMLVPGMWWTADPWPPHKPHFPPERVTLQDLFVHNHVPGYPYADDFEPLWEAAGRPYDIKILALFGGNLAKSTANTETLEKYLKTIPFAWGVFTEHNETSEGFLDIVVPEKHPLEQLNISLSINFFFNYPTGMDDWAFQLRHPVVENRYEERDLIDILFDLGDRIGGDARANFNNYLDTYFTLNLGRWDAAFHKDHEPYVIGPDEKINNREFTDRCLKYLLGPEHGLDYFRKNPCVKWKKRPEEAYWRTFCEGRGPIYFDFLEQDKTTLIPYAKKIGAETDWAQYTALLSYFPAVVYTEVEPDSEFDMLAFSYRDILHAATATYNNPLIDELSSTNPFTYHIVMHYATAAKKGIKDGDLIYAENVKGLGMTGRVKLMTGIHPQVIGCVCGGGGWAKGRPVAREKGVMFNNLLILDMDHICPITASIETAVRVKIRKTDRELKDGQTRLN